MGSVRRASARSTGRERAADGRVERVGTQDVLVLPRFPIGERRRRGRTGPATAAERARPRSVRSAARGRAIDGGSEREKKRRSKRRRLEDDAAPSTLPSKAASREPSKAEMPRPSPGAFPRRSSTRTWFVAKGQQGAREAQGEARPSRGLEGSDRDGPGTTAGASGGRVPAARC
jgi:hypothetical protein